MVRPAAHQPDTVAAGLVYSQLERDRQGAPGEVGRDFLITIRRYNMKNLIALLFCLALAACGGGSSSSGTAPAPAPATITEITTTSIPATSANATLLSNANISISTSSGDYVIQAANGVGVNVSGNNNLVEFSNNQAAGVVAISGNTNTIIARPGSSATSLTVTGIENTFWIPNGMFLLINNPGHPAITVITYPK